MGSGPLPTPGTHTGTTWLYSGMGGPGPVLSGSVSCLLPRLHTRDVSPHQAPAFAHLPMFRDPLHMWSSHHLRILLTGSLHHYPDPLPPGRLLCHLPELHGPEDDEIKKFIRDQHPVSV